MSFCQLVSVNKMHDPIELPDGELVFIGRTPETKIKDTRCSRRQLQIKANWKRKEVIVTQLGSNPSAIDTKELVKDKPTKLNQSSTLYVLVGLYPHKVTFSKEKYIPASPTTTPEKIQDGKKQNSGNDTIQMDTTRKSNKRKSSALGVVDNEVKKPKFEKNIVKNDDDKLKMLKESTKKSNKRRSSPSGEMDDEVKKSNKRRSSPSGEVDDEVKKPKLENTNRDVEKDHMKNIEEKLKMLKESAKKIKVPESLHDRDCVKHELFPNDVSHGVATKESSWQQFDTLYVYTSKGVQAREKIAAFDIDGTIITTQSGKVFPTNCQDWRMLYSEIYGKLKKLDAAGFKIVFFTNQLGVARGKIKIEDLKKKFTNVALKCAVPVQILVSTGSGVYRKPCSGMWQHFCKKLNNSVSVNMKESFYCGDAAGRPNNWCAGRKKDFSFSDRLFALNIGLKFYTPEEYFKDQKPATFLMPEFDPRKLSSSDELVQSPRDAKIVSSNKEIVVFSGYPASGKSFFAKTYMAPEGYIIVNRDTLGTWQKCVSECSRAVRDGKSVVIDNTNPDGESRKRYIDCAVKSGMPCRCFVFNISKDHVRHNERFRQMTDKTHKPVNDMILNSFKSKFTEPKLEEGFKEIVKINFVPKFDNSGHEKLYRQFLLEK